MKQLNLFTTEQIIIKPEPRHRYDKDREPIEFEDWIIKSDRFIYLLKLLFPETHKDFIKFKKNRPMNEMGCLESFKYMMYEIKYSNHTDKEKDIIKNGVLNDWLSHCIGSKNLNNYIEEEHNDN